MSQAKTSTPKINIEPLQMSFHGRVLEHLGIQMYQSPVNALAEFVANSWDADANEVDIYLPDQINAEAKIVIADDGIGMSHDDCKKRFLAVGYDRRGGNPDETSSVYKRPVLGRKGIGKFAGFGIAEVMEIDTISGGERKIFTLNLSDLNKGLYVNNEPVAIPVIEDAPEPKERINGKGTVVTLSKLKLKRNIRDDFPASMSRRFLLLQQQAGFVIKVNGTPIPQDALEDIQYSFPRDYKESERPVGLKLQEDWGEEYLDGHKILWRFMFHKEPVGIEELKGVTIYAKGKLVQAPFAFQSDKTFSGEHGLEYLTGQVEADFLDALPEDIITTERQRVNWDHEAAAPLRAWGQGRLKQLLRIWSSRRGESRRKQIEEKIHPFSQRLDRLESHEARTVRSALDKLASIPTLSDTQFQELAEALLTAWEQGRLRKLIDEISTSDDPSAERFLQLLLEQEVLSALNIAEAVMTKIQLLQKLLDHVQSKTLENELRDFIAENPWMISPNLDTYRKETALKTVITENIKEYIEDGQHDKRTDLLLRAGSNLVIVEFMRPGVKLDWEHLNRYRLYFRALAAYFKANTGAGINTVTGFIVADSLDRSGAFIEEIQSLKREDLLATDWITLFSEALAKWKEFFESLSNRQQQDPRIQSLKALID